MKRFTSNEWEQVQTLFHRALEQGGEPTGDDDGGGDPAIVAEVRKLVRFHRSSGSFLDPPTWAGIGNSDSAKAESLDSTAHASGDLIGAFRLSSRLSAGGMGEVWLAQRADPQFRQTVAVKILKCSRTAAMLQRFFDERDALARLEHPSITRLIDGGVTPAGEPFLVMEYIDGRAIDQFVHEHRLGTRQRIEMFIRVCEAVEFAHQNLIIHCDLKPANILVSSDGRPRVLDFGICRLMQNVGHSEAERNGGMPALTPQYACPEQLRGEPCTTSSDVYSLGLILRRLLDHDGVEAAGLLTRLGQNNTSADAIVQSQAPHLPVDRRWRDLKWIIQRATRLQPQQRYPSARVMIEDLQNVLAMRPVSARQASRSYRLERWVRRNSLLAISTAFIGITVALGVVGVVRAWKREAVQHRTAVAATIFLEDLLGSSTPWALQRDEFSLSFLEEASRQAGVDLHDQPAVELSVRMSLARIYASLWEWLPALREARRAEDLARTLHGDSHELVADALAIVGRGQTWMRHPEAASTQRKCLALRERLYHATHPKIAESYINLGFAKWWTTPRSRWGEADEDYRRGIELFRQSGQHALGDFARALYSYANFGRDYGLPSSKLFDLARESVELFERSHERPSRYSRAALLTYAEALTESDDPDAAIPFLTKFLDQYGNRDFADLQARRAAWLMGQLTHLQGNRDIAFNWYVKAIQGELANTTTAMKNSEKFAAGSDSKLGQWDNPEALTTWIETEYLPGFERCDTESAGLLERLAWPALLSSDGESAERTLSGIIEIHTKACPPNQGLAAALQQSLLEARVRNHPENAEITAALHSAVERDRSEKSPLLTERGNKVLYPN